MFISNSNHTILPIVLTYQFLLLCMSFTYNIITCIIGSLPLSLFQLFSMIRSYLCHAKACRGLFNYYAITGAFYLQSGVHSSAIVSKCLKAFIDLVKKQTILQWNLRWVSNSLSWGNSPCTHILPY